MTTKSSPATLDRVNWTFSTIAEMQSETRLQNGDLCQTLGYSAIADGGGAMYRIGAASGTADGGAIVALPLLTALQANLRQGLNVTPIMFGAVANGTTDDSAAITKFIAYMVDRANDTDGRKGRKLRLDFGGREYGLASMIAIPNTLNGCIIIDGSFNGLSPFTGGYLFSNSASYIETMNLRLYCNKVASGWRDLVGGRCRHISMRIYRMLAKGYHKAGGFGETRLIGCDIEEWEPNDPEFATEANFVATGIQMDDSDSKIHDTNVRWCGTCFEWTAGVQQIYNSHFVQGTAGAYARTNGRLIHHPAGATGELTTFGCYFDNGYSQFYGTDKVNLDGYILFDPADAAITNFFQFFARSANTPASKVTASLRTFQWNNAANVFNWLPTGEFAWADDYTAIVNRLNGVMGSSGHTARRLELNNVVEELATNFDGNARVITSGNIRSLIGYKDKNTAGTVDIGSSGNNARVSAPNGYLILNTMGVEFPGGVRSIVGAGTPEGNVAAPIGSEYHRTDGGAGTSFYVKETGSGNTGWVAK